MAFEGPRHVRIDSVGSFLEVRVVFTMNTPHEFHTVMSAEQQFRSWEERIATGKTLREKTPRSLHAEWNPPRDREDPIDILEKSNAGRLPDLIPIRYGRMLRSPFTFYRGSAGLMAYDLSHTPHTGLRVQACGDCHLLNFGLFATPERRLVFDINDFDETLPAPWEWDLKRLVVSTVIAGRDQGLSEDDCHEAALCCARSYREHLRELSEMSPLDVWYASLDVESIIESAPNDKARSRRRGLAERARQRIGENLFPKIATLVGGSHRLIDQPPVLVHVAEHDAEERFREGLSAYRQTLSMERRVLLDRYCLQDFALKVVGIGSVGTRCYIGLLFSEENHPLLLQVKEATRSVVEPYAGRSQFENQGQRVVMGQRLMQSSTDIFLGWARGGTGSDYYIRQLRDMKFSIPLEGFTLTELERYVEYCAWALARAHAKSGDSATISGYLGKKDQFDRALGKFALTYADQVERDHEALVKAERTGRIQAFFEENL
jgi:uncharacterized protein (DUF2252 family)